MYIDDSSPATTTGGRYVFDLAGIEAALRSWQKLADGLADDLRYANDLLGVQGPGDEPASNGMAYRGQRSGDAFRAHSKSMQEFVAKYVQNLEQARNQYLMQEKSAATSFGES